MKYLPVPVLAEPRATSTANLTRSETESGEARDKQPAKTPDSVRDSRGGQINHLSTAVVSPPLESHEPAKRTGVAKGGALTSWTYSRREYERQYRIQNRDKLRAIKKAHRERRKQQLAQQPNQQP